QVCLSLLGTWSGESGENWVRETSTVLQVLMSIQALILVPQPYFNEPGHESSARGDSAEQTSRLYNQKIREWTIIHAITGHLKNPPAEFAEVVSA
ncbi:hypothetical protein T492DRAFT_561767, partial [Pavlovales sp. CCMP2436]